MTKPRSGLKAGVRAAALLAAFLLLPLPSPAGPPGLPAPVPQGGGQPPKPAWAAAFKPFDGSPLTIAYLVAQQEFHPETFLVAGIRPKGDNPTAGRPRFGEMPGQGDWLIEDGTGAIRVTGIPGPQPGEPIILAARFADGALEPSLRGIRAVAAGSSRGTTVLRVGDFARFPTRSSKSTTEFIEFSGDPGAIESFPSLNGVIVRGVGAGTVTGKIYAQWWNRAEPEFKKEFTLKVVER